MIYIIIGTVVFLSLLFVGLMLFFPEIVGISSDKDEDKNLSDEDKGN